MGNWASFLVPVFLGLLILAAVCRRVPVFELFSEGAKEGLHSCLSLLPVLTGLLLAISMLQASGALELAAAWAKPLASLMGLPPETVPLALLKPVSGSGSTALLAQLLESEGPDSFSGRLASVLAGSTETALYCVAVYFGAVREKGNAGVLLAALAGHLVSCLCAGWVVRLFF